MIEQQYDWEHQQWLNNSAAENTTDAFSPRVVS